MDKTREGITPRGAFLRAQLLGCQPAICSERAVLVTESYQQTAGQPEIIRRARALEHLLRNMSLWIGEQELIVGNQATRARSAPIFPEFSVDWLLDELPALSARKTDRFQVSRETKDALESVLPWWKGKTVKDRALAAMDPKTKESLDHLVFILTGLSSGIGHIAVDYDRVLRRGLRNIMLELKERSGSCPSGSEEHDFYQAGLIVCQSVIDFAQRYSQLALSLAQENGGQRRKELFEIARVCGRVPAEPAVTFHEALQSFWFIHLVIQLESNGHSISPGRFDQYMYPYFENTSRERELLECLWIKFNEINKVRDRAGSLAFGGYPMFQNLIVGGCGPHGDQSNPLSLLCLKVTRDLRLPQPSMSVRIHDDSSREFLSAAARLVQAGIGMPAYFNDEALFGVLRNLGCQEDEVYDYAQVGCVEPQVQGTTQGFYNGGFLNLAKCLELALTDGRDSVTGKQVGLPTGNLVAFTSFEQVLDAYRQQVEYFLSLQTAADNLLEKVHGSFAPGSFVSLFVDDCLIKGRAVEKGGARYNYTGINAVGLANVADALMVVKTALESGTVSMNRLAQALQDDFQEEQLRQYLLNQVPKYGNDIAAVDSLARIVADIFVDSLIGKENSRGGRFCAGFQSISAHALFVGSVGASPDGRRAQMLLADGGLSAAQGRDRRGPTALIKSAASIDQLRCGGGTLLNVKVSPGAVSGAKGEAIISDLVRTYFDLGGQHIQFNVVSTKTLRDAQEHPEKYGHLVVRVAGFSVYFTAIDRTLQDDIIARTEHLV
ncbi:MAG: formate C-acetyltransferase/glycerol dehydratase family glycyl radical enzyme [Firmicutes bacterium]|nr:formate C-acetyltransferase/glycerol dehydratase family glycyl radical enzyme [Bacillota bacterium]